MLTIRTGGRPVVRDITGECAEFVAGEHADRAAVGRLLVTHVPPWTDAGRALDAATAAFGGPTTLVKAGGTYDF